MIPGSTIKAWLESKQVAVWPTVTKDLTDEQELDEAASWLQGQLTDLLRFAAETTPVPFRQPEPPAWPAPTWRNHESELDVISGPRLNDRPHCIEIAVWEDAVKWVGAQKENTA